MYARTTTKPQITSKKKKPETQSIEKQKEDKSNNENRQCNSMQTSNNNKLNLLPQNINLIAV